MSDDWFDWDRGANVPMPTIHRAKAFCELCETRLDIGMAHGSYTRCASIYRKRYPELFKEFKLSLTYNRLVE